MKKGLIIAIIAVIGIAIGLEIGMNKKGSNSINNIVKSSINSGTSNNSSNNGEVTSSGSESSNNGNTSLSSSSSSNSTSSSSEAKLNVGLKNQAALSALAPQYLQEFANIITQSTAIGMKGYTDVQMAEGNNQIYNLWNNELNKLYSNIEENLTPQELSFMKNQQSEWNSYREGIINKMWGESLGSMKGLLIWSKNALITQERCYYLFFYYLDNNNNNLDLSKLLPNLSDLKEEYPSMNPVLNMNSSLAKFNEIQQQANTLISNSKTNSELVDAYNNINNMWINEIDNVYQNEITACGNSIYQLNITRNTEEKWVDFKSNELNLAKNYYNSSDIGSIASNKVSIALTKARVFYLLSSYIQTVNTKIQGE